MFLAEVLIQRKRIDHGRVRDDLLDVTGNMAVNELLHRVCFQVRNVEETNCPSWGAVQSARGDGALTSRRCTFHRLPQRHSTSWGTHQPSLCGCGEPCTRPCDSCRFQDALSIGSLTFPSSRPSQ